MIHNLEWRSARRRICRRNVNPWPSSTLGSRGQNPLCISCCHARYQCHNASVFWWRKNDLGERVILRFGINWNPGRETLTHILSLQSVPRNEFTRGAKDYSNTWAAPKPPAPTPPASSMPHSRRTWNGKGSFKQGRVETFLTEPFRYALSQDVTTGFFCTDFLHQTSLNKRID
jgi:hypothetical protein